MHARSSRTSVGLAALALACAACHSGGTYFESVPRMPYGPGVVDCPAIRNTENAYVPGGTWTPVAFVASEIPDLVAPRAPQVAPRAASVAPAATPFRMNVLPAATAAARPVAGAAMPATSAIVPDARTKSVIERVRSDYAGKADLPPAPPAPKVPSRR